MSWGELRLRWGEVRWGEVRQMPAIWIFMWRRLPVLAAPSSQQEVIGIKLGCDICRCEMEMICKYNCLWREQNINTRHDQGMFDIYLALHTEIQNNAMVSWFLCSLLMLVNFRCSCRLQWYWRPCGLYGRPRPCLGQKGRRPSLIRRPAAAHIPILLSSIFTLQSHRDVYLSYFGFWFSRYFQLLLCR